MRKISIKSIILGYIVLFFILGTTFLLMRILDRQIWMHLYLKEYRPVVVTILSFFTFFISTIFYFRIYLKLFKIQIGYQPIGSQSEMHVNVITLIFITLINPILKSHLIPTPITGVLYRALGAKVGPNTYMAGPILDPHLTTLGKNCIIGHNAVIYSHAIEGLNFELNPVEIGDNVTIGAHAVVMSGVKVGNNSIIAAGAVVNKGTIIGENEIWGGVPARLLKKKEA